MLTTWQISLARRLMVVGIGAIQLVVRINNHFISQYIYGNPKFSNDLNGSEQI